jgi:hypothetical protein
MAVFTSIRNARKPYRCDACGGQIKAGQPYSSSSVTPKDPELGDADGKRWGRYRSHVNHKDCETAHE